MWQTAYALRGAANICTASLFSDYIVYHTANLCIIAPSLTIPAFLDGRKMFLEGHFKLGIVNFNFLQYNKIDLL